jgi:uncharacterized protein (DUF924 family)
MQAVSDPRAAEILEYWFGELTGPLDDAPEKSSLWFTQSARTDDEIRSRFGALLEPGARGDFDAWTREARGRLALVLLLDQFPRNIHRAHSEAFAYDARALETALGGITSGQDRQLYPIERVFMYLPLEHAESRELQRLSVKKFEELLQSVPEEQKKSYQGYFDYALRHAEIVERFGRFPHRNAALGRSSTGEEIVFLQGPHSSF